jgi:hypothetical protein
MRLVAGVFVFALALAGCGGGSASYSSEATAQCLRSSDLVSNVSTSSEDLDLIAENAPGGGIRGEVGEKNIEVQLAFGRTTGDTETLRNGYELFDVDVQTEGNVVIAWTFDPTEDERQAIEDCLT